MAEGGVHDRQRYVALALGLHSARRTGLLEIRSGRRWRRIHFVEGRAALFTSSLAGERLSRSLEQAGLIERNALRGLGASELDEDGLARALVAHNHVDAAEMRRQRARLLERGLGAPLSWDSGKWTFTDHGKFLNGRYDPALLPAISLTAALWGAVKTVVHMEQVLPRVSDAEAGLLVPGDRLAELLISLELTDPLAELGDHLDAGGTTLEELLRRLPDRSGHLVVLLWMLELAGAITRPGRTLSAEQLALATGTGLPTVKPEPEPEPEPEPFVEVEPVEIVPAPAAAAEPVIEAGPAEVEPKPKQKQVRRMPLRKLLALVRADHKHRMGKDFYAFLDLPDGASAKDVRATAEQLSGPWEQAADDDEVDENVRALAKDLVAGARLVVATLGETRKRREYRKRIASGKAPVVQGFSKVKPRAQTFSAPGAMAPVDGTLRPAHVEARRLLESGDWEGAIRRLSPLRQEDPSDVEVLADLGWASWKAKKDPDFIRLAVTFDSSNARALEYLGRVYAELGEDEKVATIARTLLKVDNTNPWARRIRKGGPAGRRG